MWGIFTKKLSKEKRMAQEFQEFDLVIRDYGELRGGPIVNYQGDYTGPTGSNYQIGDIVMDNNQLFLSLTGGCTGANFQPVTDPTAWAALSGTGGTTSMFAVLNVNDATGNTGPIASTGVGSYSYTVPVGTEVLNVFLVAGGGGGGNGASGGGGGGSGNMLSYRQEVTAGQIYNFNVGTGGGGAAPGNSGGTGNRSRMLDNASQVLATTLGGNGGLTSGVGGSGFYGGGGGGGNAGGTGIMENGNSGNGGSGGGEGGAPNGTSGGGGGPGGGTLGSLNGILPGAGGAGASSGTAGVGADGQIILRWVAAI